jgi:hypothetical protein
MIVKTFRLYGYSASGGTQEPVLRGAIADIARGLPGSDCHRGGSLARREDLE